MAAITNKFVTLAYLCSAFVIFHPHSASSEALPADSSALTDGNYIVNADSIETPEGEPPSNVQKFTGSIGLSQFATLMVDSGYVLDVSGSFNVGNQDTASGGMNGVLTIADHASLNVAGAFNTGNMSRISVKSNTPTALGSYKKNASINIFETAAGGTTEAGVNIGGGTFILQNGAVNYATNGENMNISGGSFDMTDSIIGMESNQTATDFEEVITKTKVVVDPTPDDPSTPDSNESSPGSTTENTNTTTTGERPEIMDRAGALNISGGTFDMKGQSLVVKLNRDDLSISGGTFNINKNDSSGKTSAILHGGSTGNLNISGGTVNLYNNAKIERAWVETKIDQTVTGPTIEIDSEDSPDGKTHTTTETSTETIKGSNLVTDIVMNGNDFKLHTPTADEYPATGDVNISGGTINMYDNSEIAVHTSDGKINVSGGTINAKGNSKLNSDHGVAMTGGALNLYDSAVVNNDLDAVNALINVFGTANKVTGNTSVENGSVNLAKNAVLTTQNFDVEGNAGVSLDEGAKLATNNLIFGDSAVLNAKNNSNIASANVKFTDSSKMNVAENSTVNVTGSGGIVSFENLSELNLGLSKLMAADSEVTFKDNASLAVKINGKNAGEHGTIEAKKISIGTENNMKVTLARDIVSKGETMYVGLFDSNDVSGEFNINRNNRYDVSYIDDVSDANYGKFAVTGIASAEDVAKKGGGSTANIEAAKAWLDSGNPSVTPTGTEVSNVLDELSQGSTSVYLDALTALAPDAAPQIQTVSTNNVVQLYNVVGTRLSGGSIMNNAPRRGYSSGDDSYSDLADRGGVWVQGLYSKSTLDDTDDAKGFEAETTGGAFGIDGSILPYLKVGAGFAYSTTDIDGFLRTTEVDSSTGFVYAEFKPNRWYVNGIASYGVSSYDEEKNVGGVKVKGSYDSDVISGQVMTGYRYGIFSPEIGARYVNVSTDEYTDSAGQKIKVDDSSVFTGIVGIKVTDTFEPNYDLRIRPEFRVAATYDFDSDGTNALVTLPNMASYTVAGEGLDKFGVEVGAGLTMDIGNSMELSARYEGTFKADYDNHTGMVDLKYKF